jgi:hypothetical protein
MDQLYLCKCVTCTSNNPDGTLLSKLIFNRHRKKEQLLSIRDDENVIQVEFQTNDQDLDVEFHENIIENINDIEDFDDFDDLEIISDNEEDDKDDDDDEDIASQDNEDDDDDINEDEDYDNNEDLMQIEDHNIISKEVIEGLQLLYLKSLHNFTEAAYNDIIKVFAKKNLSLYKVKKSLERLTGLVPIFYDMCENSCICYTGNNKFLQSCPLCGLSRYDSTDKPKKVMPYLSIKKRLEIQYNDKVRAEELLYRHQYINNKDIDSEDLEDIFEGQMYKELLEINLFNDKRDIAFTVSCDGYQIFKQKTDDCWAFLLISNNLDPSIRVKKENLLIPFLIPGPTQPKDFNSFLRPFVDEMKELESE